VLLREDGGQDTAERTADAWSFLLWQFADPRFQPAP